MNRYGNLIRLFRKPLSDSQGCFVNEIQGTEPTKSPTAGSVTPSEVYETPSSCQRRNKRGPPCYNHVICPCEQTGYFINNCIPHQVCATIADKCSLNEHPHTNIPIDGLNVGGREDVESGVYFGWARLGLKGSGKQTPQILSPRYLPYILTSPHCPLILAHTCVDSPLVRSPMVCTVS